MAHIVFDEFLYQLTTGSITLSGSSDIKVILCSELPATNLHYYTDISINVEITEVDGYTTGGQALTGALSTSSTGEVLFNADDVTWTTAETIEARCAVLYHDTGLKPLMMCFDFGETKSITNDDFVIEWNNETNAIFKISS